MQRIVFDALKQEPASRNEVAERTGLDPQQAQNTLRKLRDKGLITLLGNPRSRWQLSVD